MASSAAALSARDEQVRDRACQACSQHLALSRQVSQAQEAGEIDAGTDLEATARTPLTVMQGIEFLHKPGIGEKELQLAKTAALEMIERSVGH